MSGRWSPVWFTWTEFYARVNGDLEDLEDSDQGLFDDSCHLDRMREEDEGWLTYSPPDGYVTCGGNAAPWLDSWSDFGLPLFPCDECFKADYFRRYAAENEDCLYYEEARKPCRYQLGRYELNPCCVCKTKLERDTYFKERYGTVHPTLADKIRVHFGHDEWLTSHVPTGNRSHPDYPEWANCEWCGQAGPVDSKCLRCLSTKRQGKRGYFVTNSGLVINPKLISKILGWPPLTRPCQFSQEASPLKRYFFRNKQMMWYFNKRLGYAFRQIIDELVVDENQPSLLPVDIRAGMIAAVSY